VCPPAQTARTLPVASRPVRCVIAHEHALVRQSLRRLLEIELNVAVVAEAATASETLRAVWEKSPELVLGQSSVLRLPAGEAAHWLRRGSATTQVVFLDGETPQAVARESTLVLSKDCTVADLQRVIDTLRTQTSKVPPRSIITPERVEEKMSPLTARQCDVVRLVAQGKTVRQAAQELGVSVKTVDTHKTNLMRRLGIHNKAELVLWAVNEGLIGVGGAKAMESAPRLARRQAQAMRARSARLETSRSGLSSAAFTAPTPERADGRLTHTAGKASE